MRSWDEASRESGEPQCVGFNTGHIALVHSADEEGLIDQLVESGFVVHVLNGRKVTDLKRLYEETARALELPVREIQTWEALRDLLGEELWQTSSGKVALVWRDATTLWERHAQAFFWMIELLLAIAHAADCDGKEVRLCLLGTWPGFGRLGG